MTSSDQLIEAYRALDADEKSQRNPKTYKLKDSIGGRNTEVCFYDVTNYWFEIGQNDEDTRRSWNNK
ncbi:hypothetical protein MASR1M12_15540 [Erysipelotrichia bacterium]